eukprot:457272-Prymnesium_polylepis.1
MLCGTSTVVPLPPWLLEGEFLVASVLSARPEGQAALSLREEDCAPHAAAVPKPRLRPSAARHPSCRSHDARPPPDGHHPLHARGQAAARVPSLRSASIPADRPPRASRRKPTLTELVMVQAAAHKPHAARRMLHALSIAPHTTCLADAALPAAAASEGGGGSGAASAAGGADGSLPSFEELRSDQNHAWAAHNVTRGVAHARAGRTDDALAAYKHAIELEVTHVDACAKKRQSNTTRARLARRAARTPRAPHPAHTPHTRRAHAAHTLPHAAARRRTSRRAYAAALLP